jgi:hypothetical protein
MREVFAFTNKLNRAFLAIQLTGFDFLSIIFFLSALVVGGAEF